MCRGWLALPSSGRARKYDVGGGRARVGVSQGARGQLCINYREGFNLLLNKRRVDV